MNTLTYTEAANVMRADETATYTVETARGIFTATGAELLNVLHPSHIFLSVTEVSA